MDLDHQQKVSQSKIYFFMILMVLSGSLNTIIANFTNNHVVHKTQTQNKTTYFYYFHPWFQTQNMFLGEVYCLVVYFFVSRRNKLAESSTSTVQDKRNPLYYMIPAVCDVFASTMLNFALIYLPASVFQMLRGGIVIVTALLSYFFLKKKQYSHHIVGISLVTIGMLVVGLSAYLTNPTPEVQSLQHNFILGFVLIMISLILTGIQFVIEEKFMTNTNLHPLKLVGYEGLWGFIITTLTLPFLSMISCNSLSIKTEICAVDSTYSNYYVETPLTAIKELINIPILMVQCISGTLIVAIFNFSGISITKYVSSPQRAVLDNSKPVIIWIIFLIVGYESFIWGQLIGFIILSLGVFVYNEFIELKFWKLNENTKRNIESRNNNKDELNISMKVHLLDENHTN